MRLSYEQMHEMRMAGKTYTEIGKACGLTRQRVNYILTHYDEALKGMRGRGFDVETIVYKGLYEHFKNNMYESVTTFTRKVYGHTSESSIPTMRSLLIGEYHSRFSVPLIKKMCEVTGKTFEELFELREGATKDER